MSRNFPASTFIAACCLALTGCETGTSQTSSSSTPAQAVTADKAPIDHEPLVTVSSSSEGSTTGGLNADGADAAQAGLDWPIFLGPEGTGVSQETGLLDEWPAA